MELEDRIGLLVVDARSPDGHVSARVQGRGSVSVGIDRGEYGRYDESGLAHQLAQLATVAWARYRRLYSETLEDYAGTPSEAEDSAQERTFAERSEQLECSGRSAGGDIELRTRGLRQWDVTIAPGTLARLPEHTFVAELSGAVAEVLADHRARMVLLTDELFDLGLPSWRRLGTDVKT